MLRRRDFLAITSLAAIGGKRGFANTSGARWPGYRDALAIDGEAASRVFFMKGADPAVAKELEAIRASGLSGILLTVAPKGRFWLSDAAFKDAKESIAACKAKVAVHSDVFLLVGESADLQRAHHEKRLGVIMRFQGSEPLGEDSDRIALFRKLGVRVIQLTHNRRNLVGDGCTEPSNAGLSNYGYEVVARLNAEKVIVDLAHGGQRTIAEGVRASKAPVLISHTGCRALADLPRNVGDAELRAMGDRGGVAGIIFWPYLRTDTQPMASDVIRHIEHAIDVCGEDHVGIGTDGSIAPTERTAEFEKENRETIKSMTDTGTFVRGRPTDLYVFIPDLNMADRFNVLAGMLSARGHTDARIAKVIGGNFARVMADVWG